MKIKFPLCSNKDVISKIMTALEGRSLKDLVSFDDVNGALQVKISKLGTSTLTFSRREVGGEVYFELSEEKIAFAHKAFKDDVKDKLVSVIQKAGGSAV